MLYFMLSVVESSCSPHDPPGGDLALCCRVAVIGPVGLAAPPGAGCRHLGAASCRRGLQTGTWRLWCSYVQLTEKFRLAPPGAAHVLASLLCAALSTLRMITRFYPALYKISVNACEILNYFGKYISRQVLLYNLSNTCCFTTILAQKVYGLFKTPVSPATQAVTL